MKVAICVLVHTSCKLVRCEVVSIKLSMKSVSKVNESLQIVAFINAV